MRKDLFSIGDVVVVDREVFDKFCTQGSVIADKLDGQTVTAVESVPPSMLQEVKHRQWITLSGDPLHDKWSGAYFRRKEEQR